MKSSAKAFAPGNISCIFKIHEDKNPAKMGSLGLGFTVNKGVTVEAALDTLSFPRDGSQNLAPLWGKRESIKLDSCLRRNDNEDCLIYFNNKKINFPTVKSVVKKLIAGKNKKVKISCLSDLPLGSGFGLSGASTLATAYALNNFLGLKYSNLELAKIAHIAEVENRTGLGDVINQYFGGFLLKLKPSSEFKVKKIPLENLPVYCKYFSQLSTKAVLSDPKMKEAINLAAIETLEKIRTRDLFEESKKIVIARSATIVGDEAISINHGIAALPSVARNDSKKAFSNLISISKEFALNSGLLTNKKAINTIKKIEAAGGHASMIMLGNAVFSDIPFAGSSKLKISNTPAHLL